MCQESHKYGPWMLDGLLHAPLCQKQGRGEGEECGPDSSRVVEGA